MKGCQHIGKDKNKNETDLPDTDNLNEKVTRFEEGLKKQAKPHHYFPDEFPKSFECTLNKSHVQCST